MEYNSVISNNENDSVEEYRSIFTEVEHLFSENNNNDLVDGVMSCYDTFSLHKCINFTNTEALASNFLEGERVTNGLLAGTFEPSTEGLDQLADLADSFPDICDDNLLDIINDETSIPSMEKNDTTDSSGGEKDMDLKTTGELNQLARIFRFKTKPRARNVKRRKPETFDNLKPFPEVPDLVFHLSNMSSMIVKKKRWQRDKSLNRMRNYRNLSAVFDQFQNDDNGETEIQIGKIERRKRRHITWSGPEVLKLVEGVAQCGVGKWREIKCLFFSASHNRSAVDLKDKWRNLLRASYRSANDEEKGEWDSGCASPTIPDHILCQVRELSEIHQYPRNQNRQQKIKESKTQSNADNTMVKPNFFSLKP